MDQRCYLPMVWLTWLGLPLLAAVVGVRTNWFAAAFVLFVGVAAQIAYVRSFPRLSRLLGYGSVEDVPAGQVTRSNGPARVMLYTASACPFCPIVRRRLEALEQTMGFTLEERDVTFQPQVIRAKGLRSVPVVEAGGRTLVGNATSAELVAFLAGAGDP
jgi:glutaredoxin